MFGRLTLESIPYEENFDWAHQRKLEKYCDGKFSKIPKRDFIFARVKTGQVGT